MCSQSYVASIQYMHNLSDFQSYHSVYVDESGCDKRVGFRRTSWSLLGTEPLQVTNFHRDQRYQILPAYCQDGVVLSRIFQGSTDAAVFKRIPLSIPNLVITVRPTKSRVVFMDSAYGPVIQACISKTVRFCTTSTLCTSILIINSTYISLCLHTLTTACI